MSSSTSVLVACSNPQNDMCISILIKYLSVWDTECMPILNSCKMSKDNNILKNKIHNSCKLQRQTLTNNSVINFQLKADEEFSYVHYS